MMNNQTNSETTTTSTATIMADDTKNNNNHDNDSSVTTIICWVIGCILGVLVLLFIIRKIIQGPFYRKSNRIDGKVVVVTGCNTGIGKETALEMAKRGAKVYMACRDPVRCEKARLEIVEKSKNENVYNRTLDLASLESIRKFVETFLKDESRLDILINNAGIMATPKGVTKDGFEQQFGVNHLGHFLLTNLLLDTIKASAPSRIVVVSSAIYLFGKINKNDLMKENSYTKISAYSQSKLANILFTKSLAQKLHGTGVTVNCLHPGIVKTQLSRHFIKSRSKIFLDPLARCFIKSATAGAQTTIKLALDPSLEKISGYYYFDCIKCPVLPKAKDPEMMEWLWNKSEELINSKSIQLNKQQQQKEESDDNQHEQNNQNDKKMMENNQNGTTIMEVDGKNTDVVVEIINEK